ncbi:DEAD/DEAH box helicase [Pseudomonas aeruginosa]|uniref:DEAD/DEAH box helicase n=1 Tax=Pseudomonas aeruginosa TaxID=287 RepID=UPI001495724E|nr:DEAD/DEAH box helicase [Pseudomonas aeruginosa]MBD1322710.1 DEAD/DEAH box helicase [Pseudomonas aeruginosa]MCV0165651.1 DEAD/DEAH box helicase [Pseudomonas aeruginosa]MDV2241761.1 DEAD/DEAH box helicase [Pseudomonas aeruginosa]NPS80666.1 DEAD/DEAH box helicase [Pseudomonas aeruginosa]NPT11413.1 DEAD/DEAH box helicase [Pseudomonas aeruginosa]
MFDNDTVELINRAPELDGLDLAELPKQLTEAYASIVSARICLREGTEQTGLPDDLIEIIKQMTRLAFSLEAIVSASEDAENRMAAAFVAGSAHHVILLAQELMPKNIKSSTLSAYGVSPEVSATLLFLIAEASSDAAETAKKIIVSGEDSIEASVLKAIYHLANGSLLKILATRVPSPDKFQSTDSLGQAVESLYYMLLHGIRALAASLLGSTDEHDLLDHDSKIIFNRVKGLCVDEIDELVGLGDHPVHNVFPGPLHLASLLAMVADHLIPSSIINTDPPKGIDAAKWFDMKQSIASARPYLWRNHRQAISSGYLETGMSSVISFPTGAGKSTLSELKIATALLRNMKVVFLAPTLSLVDQTTRALANTFPNAEVHREILDELLFDLENDSLPAISVMTPERCLAMLSFNPDIFSSVGLLVFDECHLLHPRDADHSRRSIDSMLCLLNFTSVAPKADLLLLSAMMKNSEEIADWVSELTSRPCLPLALTWKPTRQVRGCVVYAGDEITKLKQRLKLVRSQVKNVNAPAPLKRELLVQPFGFFCLNQTWHSASRKDYALIPVLSETVNLSTGTASEGNNWYLTPNGNQVSATIATSTARQKIKTLVFTQTIPLANSAAKKISDDLESSNCILTDEELHLFQTVVDEFGGEEHVYIKVSQEGRLLSSSTCHHGLLLSMERHLHESLFKRTDGLNVLVATSTLAQGMNLPSEVVIISGDSRFDQEADAMQRLEAHELLNAAGRAGRAGDSSYGFVLVVPSKVVHFDNNTSQIHNHWMDLRSIFSQSDQCLVIDDPLTSILDQIHSGALPLPNLPSYFLSRLPVDYGEDQEGRNSLARATIERSFSAFRARKKGDQEWVKSRIESAILSRNSNIDTSQPATWVDRLAAASGISTAIIRELGEPLSNNINHSATTDAWYQWFRDWLKRRPALIPTLIRKETLEVFLGSDYKKLKDDASRGTHACDIIFPLLELWMTGHTLASMEESTGTPINRVGRCEFAREFVLRIVPELSYIFGLPNQIFNAITVDRGEVTESPVGLNCLALCVKEGLNSVEKVALREVSKKRLARRELHRKYQNIESYAGILKEGENFGDVVNRITQALAFVNF